MMEMQFEELATILSGIKIKTTPRTLAAWATEQHISQSSLDDIKKFCLELDAQNQELITNTLLKMSRLPRTEPKTFDNFDCRALSEVQKKELDSLRSLSFIESGRNIIFVGPPGTGKTHLAQAIGNACCQKGLKAYFIKISELKAKMEEAIRFGRTGSFVSGLTKYSCLIIDEVGYCDFNVEQTRLFFQIIDRIDIKGFGSVVITSNKEPSEWVNMFNEEDALECTLDRLTDNALFIKLIGNSYRGKKKECTTWTLDSPFQII